MLNALVVANLIASALHFGHNMLRFQDYPEPAWITGPHVVDALWLLITPLLALGWWLACRGASGPARGVLSLYAILSLCALGHYLYAAPWQLSFAMNFLILAEVAAALALLVLAPFALRRLRSAGAGGV